MGQEILYCWKCNTRILGSDFEKGTAFQVGARSSCAACASELLATLPAGEREKLLAKMFKSTQERGGTSRSLPRVHPPTAVPFRRPPPFPTGRVIGAAAALLFLVILVVLLSRGRPPAALPPPTSAPPLAEPHGRARAAIAKAREAARSRPGDVDALSQLWQEAMWAAENTPLLDEARREYGLVSAKAKEVLSKEENELRAFVEKEEFRKALEFLEAARGRRQEWADRKAIETRNLAKSLFPALKERAVETKIFGGDAKAVEDRVGKWGLEEYAAELKRALAGVGGPEAVRPESDGLVCFEAEGFHDTTEKGGYVWTKVTSPAGAVGGSAISAQPNTGKSVPTNWADRSPRADYRINFLKAGVYHVFVRAVGDAKSDDSVHIGLDGAEGKPTAALAVPGPRGWVWAFKTLEGAAATIEVPSPGLHTVNLWMREDGVIIDRVVLSPDPAYKPGGDGPRAGSR